MITSVKPCVNCGANKPAQFKEYNGSLGYEAIVCLVCGFIYDQAGAHEPETDKRSTLYVPVDQKALTERLYLKSRGTRCPSCRSTDIEGGQIDVDAGCAWQRCKCNSCDASWHDIYNLSCIELISSGDQSKARACAQRQTIGG